MNRKIVAAAAAAITGAGLVTAIVLTPSASAGQTVSAAEEVQSEIVAALSRDLKISPDQARTRLAGEQKAAKADSALKTQLGSSYAGSWLDASGTALTVAVADAALEGAVRAAGATPKTVARSASQLDSAKLSLDAKASGAPKTVPGWYVDAVTNSVVVLANAGGEAAAKSWATASGVPADALRVETSVETPVPLIDVIGGNAYTFGSGRCSIGFSVEGGFVTAGHCGTIQQKNASVTYPQGTVSGLTRTNACAEPGDSGGSWLAGDQAQGVTSGGSGNCSSGGTFYFQPISEILSVYSLRLVTSGSNPPTSTTTTPTGPTTSNPPSGTWAAGTTYAAGATVTYNGASYRALQGHTAQAGWEPPNVPALWARS